MTGESPPFIVQASQASRRGMAAFWAVLIGIAFIPLFTGFGGDAAHGVAVLIDICLVVMALMFAGIAWGGYAATTQFGPDRLVHFNGYRRRTMRRDAIKGFRLVGKASDMQLEARDGATITLPALVRADARAMAWFGQMPDLDEAEQAAEQAAFEADPGLGFTQKERHQTLGSMRRHGWLVNMVGVGIGLWAIFYPHPYAWVIAALIALPALALVWWYLLGLYYRLDRAETDPRPSFAFLFGTVPVALAVRAFDIWQLDIPTNLAIAVASGLVALGVFLVGAKKKHKLNWLLTIFLPLAIAYFYGALAEADRLLDGSTPTVYRVLVLDKHERHGKSTSYYVDVSAWDRRSGNESVSYDFYNRVKVGDTLCIRLSAGRFGLRWYTVDFC